MNSVFAVRIHRSVLVNLSDGRNWARFALHRHLQRGRSTRGFLERAGDFLAIAKSNRTQFARLPRHPPLTLHFVPLCAGLITTDQFVVQIQINSVGIRIRPHRDLGARLHPRMSPMRQQMHHRLIRPLALIEIVQVLGKASQVDRAAHKSSKRPTAMHVSRFSDVINSGPAKMSAVPR